MSKRKTRDRQLAKLAARRAAERRKRRRQRIIAGAVAGAVAVSGITVAAVAFLGNNKPASNSQAGSTPTATPSVSSAPSGTQTGTVNPQPAPRQVACGAKAPAGAGKPKPQFSGPPPMTIDRTKSYVATMVTSCGTITYKLLASQAPQTVNSFVFLAKHHFFDGQYVHRLDTSIDVVQGGDPTGTGSGGPGYQIPDELGEKPTYPPGTLAMAKGSAPNSGGSQFFIITGPNGHKLDANPVYTVFGTIASGLDVAQKIQRLPIKDPAAAKNGDLRGQQPKRAVYIDRVTIAAK
jgi:cyclophilin family peptidyl-prolyl cis-trans isomerase